MTRGRDSTVAHARSPRLAITLRGLKILEHPKTKPELWGVVVPWVSVRMNGGRAHLVDEAGVSIQAQRGFGGGWLLPEHESDVSRRMAGRAMRQIVEAWQFHFVETCTVSTRDKRGVVATPVLIVLAIFAAVVVLLVEGDWQLFSTWHGIVVAAVLALPLCLVGLSLSSMLYSGLRAVRHGARRVVYTPEVVELEFDDGRVERLEWRSIRRVRSYIGAVSLKNDQGQVYWLRSRRYLFLFAANADRLDPSRPGRNSPEVVVARLFLTVQGLALIGAGAAYGIRFADPFPLMPSPGTLWLWIGVVVPVVVLVPGFLFHRLDRRVLRPRRRVRARALRHRSVQLRGSANAE